MIGSTIRRKHEIYLEKALSKAFNLLGYEEHLKDKTVRKIVKYGVIINDFVLSIVFFLALYYVFVNKMLSRLGFEKTAIIIGVVVIFILRRANEKKA